MADARRVLAAAGIAGITFDLLFWGHRPGVSVPLFAVIAVAALFATMRLADARPHPTALWLLLPAGVLAFGPALREEPMTALLTATASLGLLGLFATTALDGQWLHYGAREHLRASLRLTGAATGGGMRVVAQASAQVREGMAPAGRRAIPVIRGAALAVPILAFFGILLGSADPVFADRVGDALSWMQPPPVGESLSRLTVVLFVTYGLAGIYAYTLRARPQRVAADGPVLPFLGSTESTIVLGSVIALFGAFVTIQIQYLFGGSSHLAVSGLSFAEYARRGFVELVVVATAALILLLVLAAGTRRAAQTQKRLFSGLAAALTLLVLVILASSFLRLNLYEQAFGFTRIRTYVHVFMGWLALLLVVLLILELRGRLRWFTTALLFAAIGFTLTLQALNVDGFIARSNVARVATGADLDGAYLANVSLDAVPALVEAATTASPALRERIDAQLACHARELQRPRPWQSTTLAAVRARSALRSHDLGDAVCSQRYW